MGSSRSIMTFLGYLLESFFGSYFLAYVSTTFLLVPATFVMLVGVSQSLDHLLIIAKYVLLLLDMEMHANLPLIPSWHKYIHLLGTGSPKENFGAKSPCFGLNFVVIF